MKNTKIQKWTLALLLTAGLTACGGKAEKIAEAEALSVSPTSSNQTTSGSSSSSSSSASSSFSPTSSLSFTLKGKPIDGSAPSVSTANLYTDSILKVRVKGGAASTITDPSGQKLSFTCLGYTLEVYIKEADGSLTYIAGTTTKPLKAGSSGCSSQLFKDPTGLSDSSGVSTVTAGVSEQIIDFSAYLPIGNRRPLVIKVLNPTYDFHCQLWWKWYKGFYPIYMGSFSQNCPLRGVLEMHSVKGQLDVQTNGGSSNTGSGTATDWNTAPISAGQPASAL